MSRWAVELVTALRGKQHEEKDMVGTIAFAVVNTAKPLTLKIRGQIISQNIYLNPALLVAADGSTDKISENFMNAPEPSALFDFLKDFHKQYVLKQNDMVLVLQTGTEFYIIAKVVKS